MKTSIIANIGIELGSLIWASTDTVVMIHNPAALRDTQRRELRPTEEVALQGSRDPKLQGNDEHKAQAVSRSLPCCYRLTLQSGCGPRASPLRAGVRARARSAPSPVTE